MSRVLILIRILSCQEKAIEERRAAVYAGHPELVKEGKDV